jgi:hypothetical protein
MVPTSIATPKLIDMGCPWTPIIQKGLLKIQLPWIHEVILRRPIEVY